MTTQMPETVTITDVALRDGLQIQQRVVPTKTKLQVLQGLLDAGVRSIEFASFVHPRLVPQMADAEQIAVALPDAEGAQFPGLVANVRGAERALSAGVTYLRVVLSVSEGHSRSNTNRSVDQGIEETAAIIERAAQAPGVRVAAGLATAFDCPFDGQVPLAQLARVVDRLAGLGIDEISLADTLGIADPMHVRRAVALVQAEHPEIEFGLHLHNTYGTASANLLAGLELGVRQFDAALGGIGGCPFAPGAAGNIATEDVVFMLERMGIATGIDLDALAKVAVTLRDAIGAPLDSSVSRALGWVA